MSLSVHPDESDPVDVDTVLVGHIVKGSYFYIDTNSRRFTEEAILLADRYPVIAPVVG